MLSALAHVLVLSCTPSKTVPDCRVPMPVSCLVSSGRLSGAKAHCSPKMQVLNVISPLERQVLDVIAPLEMQVLDVSPPSLGNAGSGCYSSPGNAGSGCFSPPWKCMFWILFRPWKCRFWMVFFLLETQVLDVIPPLVLSLVLTPQMIHSPSLTRQFFYIFVRSTSQSTGLKNNCGSLNAWFCFQLHLSIPPTMTNASGVA